MLDIFIIESTFGNDESSEGTFQIRDSISKENNQIIHIKTIV